MCLAATLMWATAHAAPPPHDITVVADDNYPPFVFRDAKGELAGMTVDLWRLWEKKTGRRVHLLATDWAKAQKLFDSGTGDVIDTVFRTPERDRTLRFSQPYEDVPVQIYADQDIAGISNIDALQGLLVGVKAGDACGEVLRGQSILVDGRYDNYQDMVNAAAAGHVRVFCMDEPAGDYLMYRAGLDARFRKSFSVYTGQVHRAYRAKDPVQLEQVEAGFDAISDEEMTELRDRWLGTRMSAWPWARYLVYVGVGGGVLVLGMMTWGMVLRRLVRQRTAALQDERQFLRILINTLPDLVWLKDEQGVYRLCNAGYEKYMGLPEAQIVGKRDEDFVDTEQARSFRQVDQRVMESGLSLVDERQVTYASDGHVARVESIKTPMRDAKGRIIGVLGLARDITQHRENEERLDRFNRLYRVLMEVNEVAARKLEPRDLYQAVCDVVVRHGGVMLAFAAEPDADRKRLVPVCWAGEQADYVDDLVLPLDGDPAQWGPTARAFHSATPQYCDDVAVDPVMGPWRAKAMAAGFQSLACLPLKVGGTVRAVCNLYTDKQAVFDEQVQQLVLRLADTVGMALEAREAALAQARAQTRLAQSEARFSQMFLTSPIGMVLCRLADQTVVDVNESWQRLIGLERDEIVGHEVDDLRIWTGEAVHERLEAIQRLRWGEDIDRLETTLVTRQGEVRDVVWSATRINLADDVFQLESFVDITLQKRATKNLTYHNERLESAVSLRTAEFNSLFQALPDQYYRLALDGTVIDHRAGVGDPVTRSLIRNGMKLQQGLPADGAERLTQALAQVHAQGQMVIDYAWSTEKDTSREQVFEARLLPLGNDEVMAVIRDATEQRALAAEREAAREEAERLARVKSEFLANMSHEIRTPLNGVLGLAQLGYLESTGQPTQKTFETILDSGRLLLGVLNDILDISKLEAGQVAIESRPLVLATLLNEAVDMVRSRADDKGLTLTLELDPDLPVSIDGDALRIEQVLMNLLSNAIKFTEQGGVRLHARVAPDSVVLHVHDSGIGMSLQEQDLAFAPFKQADSSTTRRYGGTGLGLSISKRLVELMGGRIEVSSQVGVGSCFTVYLPLNAADSGLVVARPQTSLKPVVHRERHESSLKGVRVLAAEDSEVNQIVLGELLTMEEAEFTMVHDGSQAVDLVQAKGPGFFDLVLMDVQMPVMDGYEAAQRIRIIDATLPIIGLTAHAFGDALAACDAAGMVAHVSKPYDLRKLVSAMVQHLRRRSA